MIVDVDQVVDDSRYEISTGGRIKGRGGETRHVPRDLVGSSMVSEDG